MFEMKLFTYKDAIYGEQCSIVPANEVLDLKPNGYLMTLESPKSINTYLLNDGLKHALHSFKSICIILSA